MNTIQNGEIQELIIKKSKFISIALNVNSIFECEEYIKNYRNSYDTCTHLTFAYCVGNLERCSDDGEPSGTAGKPLLNIIKQKKLTNVLLIVIRYFGGVKLGAGGLVRAYTESGVLALDNAKVVELKNMVEISFHIDFQEAFNIYVLSNFGNFRISERIGNDFKIECEKDKLELVKIEISKFKITNLEIKEVIR